MAKSALKPILAAIERKEAELDVIDSQLMGMPEISAPVDNMQTSPDFDVLAEKRDSLETEINRMRERIALIGAWEQLKNGDWSEEVKTLLKDMDVEIANIADDGATEPPMPMTPDPMAAAPMPPAADPLAAPPTPEVPAVDQTLEPPAPAVEEAPAPEATPAPDEAAATPIVSSKKSNYEAQIMKGNSAPHLRKETMANQKTSLKAAIAERQQKREAFGKEAQTRVACAHTIAKTMLPSAPKEVITAFASNLLQNPTNVLKAALRQTASNSYWSKFAETFKEVHKVELNDLLEDPSVLSKAKNEVQSELKGDPKSAAAKVADDRKDAGPQPEKYEDGRKGSEPAEIDAGKAADRPMDTVDKSSGDSKKAAKVAHGADCKGCAECSKSATQSKKADEPMPPAPAGEAPAADVPPSPEAPMPPAPAGDGAPAPEGEAPAEVLTEEKKMDILEDINKVVGEVEALETAIDQEGSEELEFTEGQPEGEELDIENIFNNEDMDEKKSALANEEEEEGEGHEAAGDDFFAPTSAADLELGLEASDDLGGIFSLEGSDADPLAYLMGSKEAASVEGFEVLPSNTGEAANHFKTDAKGATGENRDSDSDHGDWAWGDVIDSLKVEDQGAVRQPQDQAPKLEKAAAKKPVLKHIKAAAPEHKTAAQVEIVSALMGEDPEDMDFLPDDPRNR